MNLRDELAWFDNRPLSKRTVIVTRAREQASELVNLLRENGARVVQCPTIQVEGLEDNSLVEAAIEKLSNFHWIVFTSVNGVEHSGSACANLSAMRALLPLRKSLLSARPRATLCARTDWKPISFPKVRLAKMSRAV